MKAAILEDRSRIATREVEDLHPGPDEILIRTAYAGICGSDIHAFKGIHPFRKPPVILGHELSGTIVDVGKEAAGFQIGDRVTVMPLVSCGQCGLCRTGRQNICLNKKVPGVGGWHGTFAEYFLSKPSITFTLGERTDYELGVLAEPLAVAIHSVCRQGRVQDGSSVLILGGGTIGILAALVAKKARAKTVVVTDLFDFNLQATADLCGARTYAARDEGVGATILRDYPDGFDVTILCSAAPSTVRQAILLTRRGGKIVVVGMFMQPVPVDLLTVNLSELEIIGSVVYTAGDFSQAVDWLDAAYFDVRRLITHILPIERAQDALNLLVAHTEPAIKVLLRLGE